MPPAFDLINTSLQRGERARSRERNRFSGFRRDGRWFLNVETAKAVKFSSSRANTSLKRGVNESGCIARDEPVLRRWM